MSTLELEGIASSLQCEKSSEVSAAFHSGCESVFKRDMESSKSSQDDFGVAMAVDDTHQPREPLQCLKLNAPATSLLSPRMLMRDKAATIITRIPQSEECKVSPLFKFPNSSSITNDEVKEPAVCAVFENEICKQQKTPSTPKAQGVPMEDVQEGGKALMFSTDDDAQKEMMSMGTKRHRHEESTVIKSAMKTKQTPGSAMRKSKDYSGNSSVRKSKLDFAARAGRRVTPLGWFPRGQKTESYLERKIRILQKEGGKIASFDEMLGASNLHLSRIEKEKRAASAAAKEAAAARKAALVEAAWCRILKAAGIPHTAASETAEKKSEEALAAANSALDIILGSSPRSPRPEITDFGSGGSNYNIADAWESTAFDVEKEVAAALKAALMLHTHDLENDEKLRIAGMSLITITSPQSNLDSAFQPDWVDHASEASTEDLNYVLKDSKARDSLREGLNAGGLQRQSDSKLRDSLHLGDASEGELAMDVSLSGTESLNGSSDENNSLVEDMLKRVKGLQPEQCTSLATIVATRGLNALLQQDQRLELRDSKNFGASGGLGDVLVKHVSRLEAEKAAAVAAAKAAGDGLGFRVKPLKRRLSIVVNPVVPDLGTLMSVKHVSRLEREKKAAIEADEFFKRVSPRKLAGRRVSLTRKLSLGESLGKKHKSRLELEVEAARAARRLSAAGKPLKQVAANAAKPSPPKKARNLAAVNYSESVGGGLGDVLVKHKSRLEKEKEAAAKIVAATHTVLPVAGILQNADGKSSERSSEAGHGNDKGVTLQNVDQDGLASMMGMRKLSRLEMEKQAAARSGGESDPWARRRPNLCKARDQESDAWAGVSLGATLKRHVSKLEQEQAAWRNAEEEARKVGGFVH